MDLPGRASVQHGRLLLPSAAPALGERSVELVRGPAVWVRQILSGALDGPIEYVQDEDEWALVVEGTALIEVAGAALRLGSGDWVWLRSRTSHRLVHTEPGTSWVTVHALPPEGG